LADAIWDGLSLDPQTWTTSKPARSAAAQRGGVGPLALACGLSALLLVGGGIAARLSRPAEVVSAARLRPVKRTVVLAGAADLARALVADGLPLAVAAQAAAAARPALVASGEIKAALLLWPGSPARLDRLEISNPDSSGVVVVAQGPALSARRVAAQTGLRTVVRRGVMDADSFYSSAVAAGINDSLIPDFAKALSFDFDFQRDVHRGDAFEAAFEQPVDRSGTAVGAPRLIYASLSGASKSAAVYWFQPPSTEGGWFDSSGRSVKRALMRTPVDGARVSSTFGMRVHPVLGFEKFHKGIDFAAAVGTPVYAAGDGTIESAVPSATAGNWVRLRHDNGWETVYMHLNRFPPGVAGQGARVIQGQEIGEVGTTGRSTGPHLHYELHINNEPVDPTRIEVGGGTTLAGAALAAFGRERDRVDVSRAGQL
jgi:murein DD-endopeptidase MepM/ murein hydrolase activator NlpD